MRWVVQWRWRSVLGFAQLLLMDTAQPLATEQAHRVERIHTAGQHLFALINDALDTVAVESGVQPLSVEAVGLQQVLTEVVLWMEPQATAQQVRMHLEVTPSWVQADARRVRRVRQVVVVVVVVVVVNLLSNAVNELLLQALLAQRPNVRRCSAANGASGLTMAINQVPDVMLIDMQLPDFDGIELLRRMKAVPTLSAVRVIVLSANAMPEDVSTALAAGFDDYWIKPIDMKKVLEKLDALSLR